MRYVKQFVTDPSPKNQLLRWLLVVAMVTAITLGLSLPAFAQTKYVITDGDNVIVCMSNSSDPKVVIQQAGLTLGESDTYTTQHTDGISEITINRVQMITVEDGSEVYVVGSYGGTVADVLSSLDLTVGESDILSCEPDTVTCDGMTVRLTRIREEIVEYEEITPHETTVYESTTLEPGARSVLVQGADGRTRVKARVLYQNGQEVRREILSEEVLTEPANGIILQGVDRSVKTQENSGNHDYLPAHSSQRQEECIVPGTTLSYTEVLDFQATAYYCPNPELWNITYSGTEVQVGSVAVDPNFIPLGTKMYIVSADGSYVYGYAIAEDIGGAIKGKLVDLFFNTYDECINFGRRDVKIYILKDE